MKKIISMIVVSIVLLGNIVGSSVNAAVYNSELDNAVNWLYDNGLTSYSSSWSFRSEDPLTREQLAKFIVEYMYAINQTSDGLNPNCEFDDMYKSDPTLRDYIYSACEQGVMQGGNYRFSPKQYVTNEQFVAVLMRLTDGYADQLGTNWSSNYYETLVSKNIFNDLDIFNRRSPISRGDVAIMLYRAIDLFGYNDDSIYFPTDPIVNRNGDIALTSVSALKVNSTDSTLYHQFIFTNTGNSSIALSSSDYVKCQTTTINGSSQSMTHYLPTVTISAKNSLTVNTSVGESRELANNSSSANSTSCTVYVGNDTNTRNNTLSVRNNELYPFRNSSTVPDFVVDQIRIKYLYSQYPIYEILLRNKGGDTAYINASNYLTINGIKYTTPITLAYGQSIWLQLTDAPATNGSTYINYNGSEVDTSNNRIPSYDVNNLLNDYYTRTNNSNNNNNNNNGNNTYYGTPDFKVIDSHLRYNNSQFTFGVDIQNVGQTYKVFDQYIASRVRVSCSLSVNNNPPFTMNVDNACLQSSNSYNSACLDTLDNGTVAQVRFTNIYGINYGDNVSATCTVNPSSIVTETNYNNNSYTKSFYSPYSY